MRGLVVVGALLPICYALPFWLPAMARFAEMRNLIATLLASVPFAIAVYLIPKAQMSFRRGLILTLSVATVCRLAIPLGLLEGSDDAARYVWDGKVQAHGHNPYRHPPKSKALKNLRDNEIHPRIFRPDMRTVYPPLAELNFNLAYRLAGDSYAGLKWIYLAHELVAIWLLALFLRREGKLPLLAIIYAWSPLPIVQFYAGAHLDALLTPWIAAALLLHKRVPFVSGLALGCATMIRPTSALAGPGLAVSRPFDRGSWKRATMVTAGFIVACAALIAIYASAGADMLESLKAYGEHWRFNGSLFRPLEALWGESKLFRPLLYLGICVAAVAVGFSRLSTAARATIGIGLYLAFAPTIYPWYFAAILILAVPLGGATLIALPALTTLSDLVMVHGTIGGLWELPTTILCLEYGTLYGLILWDIFRAHPREPS